ncbi:leucine--tRNA ligase [Candidatus Kaiserbacteria bacterium RIFOXYB1_FULL_46_14]|uniref:Leucine--tRNA ligase n=1 Tax=Candidatus Kaiserbacteria bacterium RIFOXYB1_FULL_46_14 TaxID=1798531 RepID=A0A1F6FJW2_9BACT|nr:MAG: leucine--tRNA ligase [Candidatus Kaiserbacteria bacterium RIFOXYB1_FULL_46_14]
MHKKFDHDAIEKKWQEKWRTSDLYKTDGESSKKKVYVLDMFPYPSGEGLHVGHPKGYIATDIYSRFKHMDGYEVLHPMGWDAFGLPAENFAIKNKVHPRVAVEKNIANFKAQLAHLGFNYDWSREINTTDPEYYKWTQWIFLKLLEKGLAYESHEPINWCPSCQTGLANEDLESDGTCERCGSVVEKRPMRQWVLKITDYADRMLEDLETLTEWPEHIKEAQRNWIGRSEGAEIDFKLGSGDTVTVFTTRPDTLFGATYLVLAPEHELVSKLKVENRSAVYAYVQQAAQKTEIDRTNAEKEKTGVELQGIKAINPATNTEIPVFISDYVLSHYGTGAIMAVPAHDERDHEFAQKFQLPETVVVNDGVLVNSGEFDGLNSEDAKKAIVAKVGGRMTSTYRLNDWVFSRQRYWGEPIPVIHCESCGVVPIPYEQLPVMLPEVEHYEPTGTGESPLAAIEDWVNVDCPKCGGKGKRETNTMPQWAGSSWYYLRFIDPKNDQALIDPAKEKKWAPVDVYVGGDHAVRHLIYARFWHKFLYDIDVVHTIEPFMRLEFLGFILAEDGRKMSKRWGNIINPDDIVKQNGADTLRVYEMFMGPFENTVAWSTNGLVGAQRFIERVNGLSEHVKDGEPAEITRLLHKTIKKVRSDIEEFKFNTAVSAMMIFVNAAEKGALSQESYEAFIKLLAPFAPHLTEELWAGCGQTTSVHLETYPEADESLAIDETVTIGVQINGKSRGSITIAPDADEAEAVTMAKAEPSLAKYFAEGEIKKVIYVQGRILNLMIGQ